MPEQRSEAELVTSPNSRSCHWAAWTIRKRLLSGKSRSTVDSILLHYPFPPFLMAICSSWRSRTVLLLIEEPEILIDSLMWLFEKSFLGPPTSFHASGCCTSHFIAFMPFSSCLNVFPTRLQTGREGPVSTTRPNTRSTRLCQDS